MQGCERAINTLSVHFKDPAPQYQPIERKKRTTGKSRRQKEIEHFWPTNKKTLALFVKIPSPTASNTGSARSFHRDNERE